MLMIKLLRLVPQVN